MTKIKNILVSQPRPAVVEKSPFWELSRKYNATIDYVPFIRVEGVSLKEFRAQRIEILSCSAIIFTSRTTIDNFFRIADEARITIPETMKYLCNTEAVALYLQKYIVYRKRKIFFADGTFTGLMELLLKHKNEKCLLTLSEPHKPEIPHTLDKLKFKYDKLILSRTVSADVSGVDLKKYQLLVFYSPAEIRALAEAFPGADLPMIATFGEGTTRTAIQNGLVVNAMAPTPEVPSMAKALDLFIHKVNAGETVPPVSLTDNHQADEFVKAQQSKELKRARAKKSAAPTKSAE